MIAASYSLVLEGVGFDLEQPIISGNYSLPRLYNAHYEPTVSYICVYIQTMLIAHMHTLLLQKTKLPITLHIHIDGMHGLLYSSTAGTITGFITGIIFLVITKRILDSYEHSDISDLPDLTHLTDLTHLKNDINKMFLIIFVMTLHSLTEGIGIGVSFGKFHVVFDTVVYLRLYIYVLYIMYIFMYLPQVYNVYMTCLCNLYHTTPY